MNQGDGMWRCALIAAASLFIAGVASADDCGGVQCGQKSFQDWEVAVTSGFINAVASSSYGGLLSYMCIPGKPRCQWAVVMPDADCQAGGSTGVSIKGNVGVLIVSARCNSLPKIGSMSGAGRSLAMDGDVGLISHAISIQDITITTTGAKGQIIRHRFSGSGAREAITETNSAMQIMSARTAH